MKTGTQVALAVAAGYLLGRRRKMRLAMMLGGAAMTGGLGGVPGQLLRRGAGLLGSADVLGKVSPELGEVGSMITGELVPVGKAAARTAVTGRINALSDRVHERAEALRNPEQGQPGGGTEGEEEEQEGERPARRPARARRAEGNGQGGDDEDRGGRRSRDQEGNGYRRRQETEEPGDEEEPPRRSARRPVRAESSRAGAPVRRARR